MFGNRIAKSLANRFLPKGIRDDLRAMRRLIGHDSDHPQIPFDNTYPWLSYAFSQVIKDRRCGTRPQYVWGVAQGAALAIEDAATLAASLKECKADPRLAFPR